MGISRVRVKASRAFGPRRLHTNTNYIVLASAAALRTLLVLAPSDQRTEGRGGRGGGRGEEGRGEGGREGGREGERGRGEKGERRRGERGGEG